ncbi:MAG: tRNA pseudouridine(55) synthase TruB [Eubacteriaceae bacterium]
MAEYHGYLNVYKEKGMTSHDVVFKCRKILGTKKIGHTGTLDPNAEGVLVLCIGKATKMVEYLMEQGKVYEAQIIFGLETDTCDITGQIINKEKSQISRETLQNSLKNFTGEIMQKPPIYSALKINGKKLYQYAREGKSVEIPERLVSIESIQIVDFSEKDQMGKIIVVCSKGTYIRSLCRDIGLALGTIGCMGELKRLSVGKFSLGNALKITEIEKETKENEIADKLYDLEYSMESFRRIKASEQGERFLRNGNKLFQWNVEEDFNKLNSGEVLRLYIKDEFIGMGKFFIDNECSYVKPMKLM